MNNADAITFNAETVNTSLRGIIKAYDELYYALNTGMQSGFIDSLADLWACGYSKEFFGLAKAGIDALIIDVNIIFPIKKVNIRLKSIKFY